MGGSEILLILLVALLLFGSNKIPDIARMIGRGMREFNKAKEDIKREINSGTNDIHDNFKDFKKSLNDGVKDIKKDINTDTTNSEDNFVI